jgi:hypothetical protein
MSRRRRRTKEASSSAADQAADQPADSARTVDAGTNADASGSTGSDERSTDGALAESPGEAPQQSVLNIKVAPTADIDKTLERLQRVDGFRAIEPLFPGETQSDLSTIYVAHVDSDRVAAALPEIEADDDVEYVEEPASRKLIR